MGFTLQPVGLRAIMSRELYPLSYLENRKVFLLCGIASPESFYNTVSSLNAVISGTKAFADHYWYTEKELESIVEQAQDQADCIITTEKDAVRLQPLLQNKKNLLPILVLEIEHKLVTGEENLKKILQLIETK